MLLHIYTEEYVSSITVHPQKAKNKRAFSRILLMDTFPVAILDCILVIMPRQVSIIHKNSGKVLNNNQLKRYSRFQTISKTDSTLNVC